MLIIAEKLHTLSFSSLMEIYEEGNREKAREQWPDLPPEFALQMAEQEFYQYLRESFFTTKGAVYAVWRVNGKYVSALRLEPYRDGLLLAALETAPAERRHGYGEALIRAVLEYVGASKVYSHVHKQNEASLKLHEKCGFQQILEFAVYLDGSVHRKCRTFCHESGNGSCT